MRFALVSALLVIPALAQASTWEIDPAHSKASFSVRHLMVSNVQGEFGKVTGAVEMDDKDVTKSTVTATIDASTIDTREAQRDAHLKSADFFQVDKYPSLVFKSKKVEKTGKNSFKVLGELTLRDVTKEVVLDVDTSGEVKDLSGNTVRGATATTKINRKDYGLKWNKALEGGGVLVGDEVKITIDVELVKKQSKKS